MNDNCTHEGTLQICPCCQKVFCSKCKMVWAKEDYQIPYIPYVPWVPYVPVIPITPYPGDGTGTWPFANPIITYNSDDTLESLCGYG